MSKKKAPPPIVTFVEDPYGISTMEIIDAQNESDELILDTELNTELDPELTPSEDFSAADAHEEEDDSEELDLDEQEDSLDLSSESMEAQLSKLAQAISAQATQEETPSTSPLRTETDPEVQLAAQIAEDQALETEAELIRSTTTQTQEETPQFQILDIQEVQSCIEAILFISDKPVSAEKLRTLLGGEFSQSLFQEALSVLQQRYQAMHHGIELLEVAGGYQLRTKPGRTDLAQKLVRVQTQKLSSGSMETLAIVAYKQPIMKEEIDKIRGVDSSYFVRGLLDKKLIQISGRSELPGRPILYNTTHEFLEIFGLKDLSSLPSLRELEQMIPSSQTANPEDDDPRVKEMRRLVGEMKADKSSALHYNPKEDEKILKEIREKVTSIPSSTPYLDELKAAELLAQEQQKLLKMPSAQGEPSEELSPENKV